MENNKITDILSEWKKQSGGIKVPEWEEIVGIGLYMDQVTALVNQYLSTTEVTPAMINNYVKLKIMPAPAKKKYSRSRPARRGCAEAEKSRAGTEKNRVDADRQKRAG